MFVMDLSSGKTLISQTILYEKTFDLKLPGNEVYYAA